MIKIKYIISYYNISNELNLLNPAVLFKRVTVFKNQTSPRRYNARRSTDRPTPRPHSTTPT